MSGARTRFIRDARRARLILLVAVVLSARQTVSHAGILGGFDPGDGYNMATPPTLNTNLLDRYNAGAYGTNNGGPGGAFTPVSPGTGLWQELRPTSSGWAVVSGDGNHTSGGFGPSLDFRGGNTSGFRSSGSGTVDGEWRYTMDTRDFGGAPPSSINDNAVVTVSFYYCGGVVRQGDDPGVFRMAFADGMGVEGLEFGLWDTSRLFYRDAGGDHVTGVFMGPGGTYPWTNVRVVMDFVNDTFSIGINTSLSGGVFASDFTPPALWLVQNAPMNGGGMKNLASLRFWVDSETGAAGSTGVFNTNKQLIDDVTIYVQYPIPVHETTWSGIKGLFGHVEGPPAP